MAEAVGRYSFASCGRPAPGFDVVLGEQPTFRGCSQIGRHLVEFGSTCHASRQCGDIGPDHAVFVMVDAGWQANRDRDRRDRLRGDMSTGALAVFDG